MGFVSIYPTLRGTPSISASQGEALNCRSRGFFLIPRTISPMRACPPPAQDEVLELQKETKDLRSQLESARAEIQALKTGTASETEKGSAAQRAAPEVVSPSPRGGNARKTLPGMERSSDSFGSSSAPACSNIKQVSSKITDGRASGAARPQELERGELGGFPRVPPQANAQGLRSSDRAEVVSSTARRESRLSSLFGGKVERGERGVPRERADWRISVPVRCWSSPMGFRCIEN